MSGRTSFSKLREEIERDPARRKRMEEKREAYDALLELADLAELRKSQGITQADLAERLGVSQPNVSKIEAAFVGKARSGKTEVLAAMQLSTLAHYVEALGGYLEVRAVFPEHPDAEAPTDPPQGR